MSAHLKNRQMPPKGWTHIFYVNEPHAGLADNQRVGWRWNDPIGYVWLKIHDAGTCEIKVVAPSANNWIRLNTRVTVTLEKGQKHFPHFA
jgi:hypothetical protein